MPESLFQYLTQQASKSPRQITSSHRLENTLTPYRYVSTLGVICSPANMAPDRINKETISPASKPNFHDFVTNLIVPPHCSLIGTFTTYLPTRIMARAGGRSPTTPPQWRNNASKTFPSGRTELRMYSGTCKKNIRLLMAKGTNFLEGMTYHPSNRSRTTLPISSIDPITILSFIVRNLGRLLKVCNILILQPMHTVES